MQPKIRRWTLSTMGGPGLVAVGSHDGPDSDVDAAVWVDAP